MKYQNGFSVGFVCAAYLLLKCQGKSSLRASSSTCQWRLPSGRITGLIGPNGSGKSTTYKAILNLIKINNGKIEIFGKDINDLTPSETNAIRKKEF